VLITLTKLCLVLFRVNPLTGGGGKTSETKNERSVLQAGRSQWGHIPVLRSQVQLTTRRGPRGNSKGKGKSRCRYILCERDRDQLY